MAEMFRYRYDDSEVRHLAAAYPGIFMEETERVLLLITARLEADVVQGTPRGVGGAAGLAGSIFGEVQHSGVSVRGIVGTPVAYGDVVELGRRPGSFPPVAPIALWAERKLGVSATEAESAAFLIARKIFHRGTEGAYMFRNAWRARQQWVDQMLRSIPGRIMSRIGGGQ